MQAAWIILPLAFVAMLAWPGVAPREARAAAESPEDRMRHAQAIRSETRDPQGRTPLLIAVAENDLATALRLIADGADINAQAANHDSPWLLAGALGRTAMLEAMLATGRVDYARRNRYGGNALIPACERGHVETVRLLLEKSRIDVDHVNNLGWTALLEAVMLGDGGDRHVEIVRLLILHRANVNLADRDGVTPLRHARQRGYGAIARLLESAGGR